MEDSVSTFGLKSEVLIVTSIDAGRALTEFKDIIISYKSIKKTMVDSHCEIIWADKSGTDSRHHPTANYGAGLDDPAKQAVQAQKRLMH